MRGSFFVLLAVSLLLLWLNVVDALRVNLTLIPVVAPLGSINGAIALADDVVVSVGGQFQSGSFRRTVYIWNATISASSNGLVGWFRANLRNQTSTLGNYLPINRNPFGGFSFNTLISKKSEIWSFDFTNLQTSIQKLTVGDGILNVEDINDGNGGPTSRRNGQMSGLLADGKSVIVAGGCQVNSSGKRKFGGALSDAFIFDTENLSWKTIPPLPIPLFDAASGLLNDEFIIIGGRSSVIKPSAVESISPDIWVYDTSDGFWRNATSEFVGYSFALAKGTTSSIFGNTGITYQNNLFRFGGCFQSQSGVIQVQNITDVLSSAGEWEIVPDIPPVLDSCQQSSTVDPLNGVALFLDPIGMLTNLKPKHYSILDKIISPLSYARLIATQLHGLIPIYNPVRSFQRPIEPATSTISTQTTSQITTQVAASKDEVQSTDHQFSLFIGFTIAGLVVCIVAATAILVFLRTRERRIMKMKNSQMLYRNSPSLESAMGFYSTSTKQPIPIIQSINSFAKPTTRSIQDPIENSRQTIMVGNRAVPVLSAPPPPKQKRQQWPSQSTIKTDEIESAPTSSLRAPGSLPSITALDMHTLEPISMPVNATNRELEETVLAIALEDIVGSNSQFLSFSKNDIVEIVRWKADVTRAISGRDSVESYASSLDSYYTEKWGEGVNMRTHQQGYFLLSKLGAFKVAESPILPPE
ncbi:hypothetical protein HK096_010736 [Nowakowskiella sp. JEL0078]|nr:hypothetical protein HK096_010736 [Nowakowskiella sp. JEL0078]